MYSKASPPAHAQTFGLVANFQFGRKAKPCSAEAAPSGQPASAEGEPDGSPRSRKSKICSAKTAPMERSASAEGEPDGSPRSRKSEICSAKTALTERSASAKVVDFVSDPPTRKFSLMLELAQLRSFAFSVRPASPELDPHQPRVTPIDEKASSVFQHICEQKYELTKKVNFPDTARPLPRSQ